MLKAKIAFGKAVALIAYKKAVAAIELGLFVIFKYFTDTASVSDQHSLDISKPFSDAGVVADQQTLATAKGLAEAPTAQEQASFDVEKPVSDTLTTADSGLILMQDYVEITGSYFLEDYVGTGQII
jgi:hypothetical protein